MARRKHALSPWGEDLEKRLAKIPATKSELARCLRISSSYVYHWIIGEPPKQWLNNIEDALASLAKARASEDGKIAGANSIEAYDLERRWVRQELEAWEKAKVPIDQVRVWVSRLERYGDLVQAKATEFERVLRDASNVIWTTDLGLNFTYMSEGVRQLRGYTSEEAVKLSMEETLTEESYKRTYELLSDQLAQELAHKRDHDKVETIVLRNRTKWGTDENGIERTVDLEVQANFLRDSTHRPVGIIGVSRDVTDRVLVEEKMLELVGRAGFGLIGTSRDGRIMKANQCFADMVDRPVVEVLGQSYLDLTHPDDVGPSERRFAELMDYPDKTEYECEKSYVTPEGSAIPCRVTATEVSPGSTEPHAVVVLCLIQPLVP